MAHKDTLLLEIMNFTYDRQESSGFNKERSLFSFKDIYNKTEIGSYATVNKILKSFYVNKIILKNRSKYYLNPEYFDYRILSFIVKYVRCK